MATAPTITITSEVTDYYGEGRTVIRRYVARCSCGNYRGADRHGEAVTFSDDHAAWHGGLVHIIDQSVCD